MLGRFWVWLADNFGFLTTKGFVITNLIGLSSALSFYFFLVRGDGLNPITIGESAFVGVVTFFLGHFVGVFVCGDNWPGLHFESPNKYIDPPDTTKRKPERFNPCKNDIPAVQTAWEIMQNARDEANGVRKGN